MASETKAATDEEVEDFFDALEAAAYITRPIIRADFNSASSEGVLFASSRFLESAPEDLRPGAEILVHDHEGNSCEGVVTELDRMAVRIKLSWATWKAAAAVECDD